MPETVIVDALRTPFGRRGRALAGIHPVNLLGGLLNGLLEKQIDDPEAVEQVIGGCVSQAGAQSSHLTRAAWLQAGLPERTGATTIDSQCGSGQQAVHLIAAQIAAGVQRVGVACGVESMSTVPLRAAVGDGEFGHPRPDDWSVDMPDQFTAADRIAERRGLSRTDLDAFGLRSQQRAAVAWAEGRFDREIVPVATAQGPFVRDQGLRESSAEGLAALSPILSDGLHTAATASQISDGAAAALLMDADSARSRGLRPRGRIIAQTLIGAEPYYLLDGPVLAAERLLERTGMTLADIDLFEVNEAFASVPLSFARTLGVDEDRLNVNGGAIALGHPVGATGVRLLATVLSELERRDAERALIAICAGGAMATGMIVERM